MKIRGPCQGPDKSMSVIHNHSQRLSFVPVRNAVSESPILNGLQFIFNKEKNESTYCKCALFKHLRQSDLMEEYLIPDFPVREYFSMMGAIASVPVDKVEQTWRHLKPLIPSDMESFATYYENTWIGTSSRSPLFAHEMWNQLLPRSTNIAEGIQLHDVLHQSHSMEVHRLSTC